MKNLIILTIAIFCLASCKNAKLTQTDIELANQVSSWDTIEMIPKVQRTIAKHKTDTMIFLDYCANSCFCNSIQYLGFVKNGEVELFKTIWGDKKRVIRINKPEVSKAMIEFLSKFQTSCNEKDVDYSPLIGFSGGPRMSLNIVVLDKMATYYPLYSTCIGNNHHAVKKWAESLAKLIY